MPWILALALALSAASCRGDDDGPAAAAPAATAPDQGAGSEAEAPADAALTREVRYDDSTVGLESLASDLRAALDAGDEAELALLLDSLRLRGYEDWFATTFGKRVGRRLAGAYEPWFEEIGLLSDVLREQLGRGLTVVSAERFTDPGDEGATGYQSAALRAMRERVPLYSLRLSSRARDATFHLWSFVHEDGSFRYVGKLKAVSRRDPPEGRDPLEFRRADAAKLERARR